ncbi:MAG: 23S rRNA (adenine(2030)-N(6))-methyltransferase RlmJ [Gammaproteobacteria bacterium]|nr:23S rRNA (adenine(2030)-N(6))-methyltransferase RlmJ [Gammaproteobacteria bacterium]
MKYRHSFHAGNFADVHKHVTLLALIASLQRKDKGFLYLETHAGRGLYDLHGADTHQGAEARLGIGALQAARCDRPQVAAYLDALARARGNANAASAYAGSPVLAALALRAQDRGVCCEIQAAECRALERALRCYPRMRCECGDGYQAIGALLPPPERRALVLIDPPYEEQADDLQRATDGLGKSLARLANAVVALWYPIKDDRDTGPWLERIAPRLPVPALVAELWLHPRDARVGLNGSGLLIANPPYQLDVEMAQWLPALGAALGATRQGGSTVRWIAHEQH